MHNQLTVLQTELTYCFRYLTFIHWFHTFFYVSWRPVVLVYCAGSNHLTAFAPSSNLKQPPSYLPLSFAFIFPSSPSPSYFYGSLVAFPPILSSLSRLSPLPTAHISQGKVTLAYSGGLDTSDVITLSLKTLTQLDWRCECKLKLETDSFTFSLSYINRLYCRDCWRVTTVYARWYFTK